MINTTIKPFGSNDHDSREGNANYEKNLSKQHKVHCDQTQCCCYCGKAVRNQTMFAYLTNIGQFADMAERQARVISGGGCDDDLGMYPVGSDCAKTLKKHGVQLYTFDGKKV